MSRCPGVRGWMPSGLWLCCSISGLEFRQASTCAVTVDSSSYVSFWSPTTFFKWCLAVLTAASHRPPKWGALSGIVCQVMWLSRKNVLRIEVHSVVVSSLYRSSRSFLAPRKFPPLSECRSLGSPLLDANRFRAARKASVVKPVTTSKWTLLVAKQTKTARNPLMSCDFLVLLVFMKNGPA